VVAYEVEGSDPVVESGIDAIGGVLFADCMPDVSPLEVLQDHVSAVADDFTGVVDEAFLADVGDLGGDNDTPNIHAVGGYRHRLLDGDDPRVGTVLYLLPLLAPVTVFAPPSPAPSARASDPTLFHKYPSPPR